jgi:hypothetical protein
MFIAILLAYTLVNWLAVTLGTATYNQIADSIAYHAEK